MSADNLPRLKADRRKDVDRDITIDTFANCLKRYYIAKELMLHRAARWQPCNVTLVNLACATSLRVSKGEKGKNETEGKEANGKVRCICQSQGALRIVYYISSLPCIAFTATFASPVYAFIHDSNIIKSALVQTRATSRTS